MITMRICKRCSLSKAEGDFYANDNSCKGCRCARVRANRLSRVGYYRSYDRARNKEPERAAMFIEKTRRMRRRPYFQASHNAVKRAVEKGTLVNPGVCSRCPSIEHVQAHHDDHSRYLDVIWLCPVCHAARHQELGRLRAMAKAYGAHQSIPMGKES